MTNLKGSGMSPQSQKINSKELEIMRSKLEDLEQLVRKLRKENSDLAESRDMYKKELDNLTFEYDKLNREARNARQDKAKLEKKLKKSINEFIIVQEEKATIEKEKEKMQSEMILVREKARKEVSKMSQIKLRLEQDLLIQQQKTAQIFVDYEAHRKLIKIVGGTDQARSRSTRTTRMRSRTRTSTSTRRRTSTARRSTR